MSELYYHRQGDASKPAVMLLHSGGMTHAEWQPQFDVFAEHFDVIAPDQLGHGRSPMVAERLRIGDIGRALIALLDKLDVARTSLVGSSMGGAVALWVTVNYPDRVDKLVLFRAGYQKSAATFQGTQELADPDYWRRMGMERQMSRQHQPQGGADAWQQVIKRVMEAHDPEHTDHHHELDTLKKLAQPTLIVCGDRDPLVPLQQLLGLYRTLPNAGLWLLPYTSHVAASNTWRAPAFAQEVAYFLKNRGVVKYPSR